MFFTSDRSRTISKTPKDIVLRLRNFTDIHFGQVEYSYDDYVVKAVFCSSCWKYRDARCLKGDLEGDNEWWCWNGFIVVTFFSYLLLFCPSDHTHRMDAD